MFEKSGGYPRPNTEPVITFTHEVEYSEICPNKHLVVQCDITHDEPDIIFDVYWYIGNKLVKENEGDNAIYYTEFPARLWEIEWVDQNPGFTQQLDTEVIAYTCSTAVSIAGINKFKPYNGCRQAILPI